MKPVFKRVTSLFGAALALACGAPPDTTAEDGLAEASEAISNATQDLTNSMHWTVRVESPAGYCSGTMVTNQWVLTANHCLAYTADKSTVTVTLARQTPGQQQSGVADVVRFPGNSESDPLQHEDALLFKLTTPFVLQGSTSGFARYQWPLSSASLNDPGRTILRIGWGGAGTYQTYAEMDPQSVTVNKIIYGVSVGDAVNWNCTQPLPCVVPGDSGGGGFATLGGLTFQTDIAAGTFDVTYSLATSTPTVRNWLDKSLFTAGANVFDATGSGSGIGVSTRGQNKLDLFWLDTAGILMWKKFEAGWYSPVSLGKPNGVTLTDRPAAVSWSSTRIDVFVRGYNGSIWHRYYDGGSWIPGWDQIAASGIASSPAVTSWAPNRLDVFAKGTDNTLWHKWYDSGWGGSGSFGGVISSAPAAVSWGFGRFDVVARVSDGSIWQFFYDNGAQGWAWLGGSITGDPAIATWGLGRLDIFGRGTNGNVTHRWYRNAWLDSWIDMGIALPQGSPSAVAWGHGRIDLFAANSGWAWQSFFPRP